MPDNKAMKLISILGFLGFITILAFGSQPADAQRAAHHELRYGQLSQTLVTLTSAGDTNETSFSSTAHQVRVQLDPSDTGTVHIAFGTTDADTDDITIASGSEEQQVFKNVEVDNINVFSNHGNGAPQAVRIMALELQ